MGLSPSPRRLSDRFSIAPQKQTVRAYGCFRYRHQRRPRAQPARTSISSLPRNQLICLTGVSGSGKSSLAFDTLYAEGQRRYVESLSSFARQFLGQMPKPDVDYISGLSPSISISQKSSGQNPRSTVGTITEIYDYLRVLYARVGPGTLPASAAGRSRPKRASRSSSGSWQLPAGTQFRRAGAAHPRPEGRVPRPVRGPAQARFRPGPRRWPVVQLTDDLQLDRQMRHNIEVVIDRLVAGQARARLAEAVELALKMGQGNLIVAVDDRKAEAEDEPQAAPSPRSRRTQAGRNARRAAAKKRRQRRRTNRSDIQLSAHYACTHCGLSFEPPSPQLFSFNSPQGMCPQCDGLGEIYSFDPERLVPDPELSFEQGCIELVGPWRDMGRWRRHIYQGVADTIERQPRACAKGTMLETPWDELDPRAASTLWLWGTGDEHITFTWRSGAAGNKYGGTVRGHHSRAASTSTATRKSKMQRRQLEKYMQRHALRRLRRARGSIRRPAR